MIQCQNCRKSNPDGNEYCGHCGSKLAQSNPQPAERKYPPGKEPEEIKRLLKAFLVELHREFPDHIVDYSRWNHEKWDKPAKYLCKQLEYKGLASMLRAYGFRIKRSASTNDNTHRSVVAENQFSEDKLPQKDIIRKPARKKNSNKKWYVIAGIFSIIIFAVCLLVLRGCDIKPQSTDVVGEWVLDGILQDGNTIHGTGNYEYCSLRLSEEGIVNYLSDPQDYGMFGLYDHRGTDGHGQLLFTVLLSTNGNDALLTMIYSSESDSILLLESENDGLIFVRSTEQTENQTQTHNYQTNNTEMTEYDIHNDEDAYKQGCHTNVEGHMLTRYPDQYMNQSFSFRARVLDVHEDGTLWLTTDDDWDGHIGDSELYAIDCRRTDTTKLLFRDYVIVYGDFVELKDGIACMNYYYVDIFGSDHTFTKNVQSGEDRIIDSSETTLGHSDGEETSNLLNAAYETLMSAEFGSTDFARYCLYDVNGDSVDELIIVAGTCEADAQLLLYEYSDGMFSSMGVCGDSHVSVCGKTSGDGITVHNGHMGYETIKDINIVNGEMFVTILAEDREAMEGYTEFDYCIPLEFHSIGDYSVLGIENSDR